MTKDDLLFLQCLEEAGVDNWEGYTIAQDMYNEQVKQNKIDDEFSNIVNDIFVDCSVESTPDPHLPDIVYDGDISELYDTMKKFVFKVEGV